MLHTRIKRHAPLVLRLMVAGVFIAAALGKLRDPAAFAEETGNYQLFPELANYIAIAVPSIELVCAACLLLGRRPWRNGAALALVLMLAIFSTAIARAWALGLNLECGCFGTGSTHVGPWPILRNLGLASALALALWLDRPQTSQLG